MLYPIRFRPRLKERIWGGSALAARKGLRRRDEAKRYGESWDLSGLAGEESVVANGMLRGNNLQEIVEVYMGDLVGERVYERFGLDFPLLIKTIDACERLSIQVHPGDELAALRHGCYGKSEMWYVTRCRPGACVYIGFSDRGTTRERYEAAVADGSLPALLNRIEVHPGDAFFIPAGTIHTIGEGVELVEIQQSSDITYRVSDWGRTDERGHPRELHTALAAEAIEFGAQAPCRLEPRAQADGSLRLLECPWFTVNVLEVEGEAERDLAPLDSFAVYICLEGEAMVRTAGGEERLREGELLLIPAEADSATLFGRARLLEVYVA